MSHISNISCLPGSALYVWLQSHWLIHCILRGTLVGIQTLHPDPTTHTFCMLERKTAPPGWCQGLPPAQEITLIFWTVAGESIRCLAGYAWGNEFKATNSPGGLSLSRASIESLFKWNFYNSVRWVFKVLSCLLGIFCSIIMQCTRLLFKLDLFSATFPFPKLCFTDPVFVTKELANICRLRKCRVILAQSFSRFSL